MKILFDHQVFTFQRHGGISRYFYELVKSFNDYDNVEWDLGLKYSENDYLLNSTFIHPTKFFSVDDFLYGINFRGKAKVFKALRTLEIIDNPFKINKKISSDLIRKGDFNILHPTYYDPYFLNLINDRPFVLTIYDMIHELYNKKYPIYNGALIKQKQLLAQKAERIIAISENTKKDIIEIYGIDENKIHVIYLGSSLKQFDVSSNIKLPERYILFIGERGAYKNFEFFLKSISSVFKEDKELYLICGGANAFTGDEIKLINSYDCQNRVLHVTIKNDNILVSLYKNALAFIFPSLYEGFGIPILEAFSCGCPAILSKSSSFPEIAGDAAMYFDPEDKRSIKTAVSDVIYNNKLREELTIKGFQMVKRFSWESTTQETLKVYEKIV